MKNKLSRLSVILLIVLVMFAAGVLVVNPSNLAASASHLYSEGHRVPLHTWSWKCERSS